MTDPTETNPRGLLKSTAQWSITLDGDCPHCKEFVNLLDYCDFWNDHEDLGTGEHMTERSKNVEVVCPSCGEEYIVELEL